MFLEVWKVFIRSKILGIKVHMVRERGGLMLIVTRLFVSRVFRRREIPEYLSYQALMIANNK